jgi:hypothetical protein
MISSLLPLAVLVFAAIYLICWRAGMRRRNAQTWDSLVARLQPDWSVRASSESSVSIEGLNASLEEKWNLIQGARGLWAMHENAGVMLEMADYAVRHSESVDREFLETLRSDAMQIRQYVRLALVQYAFSQVNESICAHAYRAASMYIGMATQVTEFLEVSSGVMLPDYVAAM